MNGFAFFHELGCNLIHQNAKAASIIIGNVGLMVYAAVFGFFSPKQLILLK